LRQRLRIPNPGQQLEYIRNGDAGSTIAKFNGGSARMEEYAFNFNLNGHVLDVSGNVSDFVSIGDQSSETPTSRVILSGNGQQIYGLYTATALDVTGPDVHVIGACADYCYGSLQARGNVAVSGALTIETDAQLYVDGLYSETDEPASGDLLITGQVYGMNSSYIYVPRDIQISGAAALLRVDGADVNAYRDLLATNSATVDLIGCAWADFERNVVLTNSATFNIGAGTYVYGGGDFSTASNAILRMQGAEADLDVSGDMSMDGASTVGNLTAGYIYLYGDLSASGTGFAPSGKQETSFGYTEEDDVHTIAFSQPGTGTAGSHFARLFAYGTLSSATPIFVDGDDVTYDPELADSPDYDLWVCGTLTTPAITVGGSIFLCDGTNLVTPQTTMTGPDGLIYVSSAEPLVTDLTVQGTVHVTALALEGDIHVTGALAHFSTGGSSTTINGSMLAENSASITIDDYSVVGVTGDVTTQTGATFNMYSGGRLFLTGSVHLGGGVSHWDDGLLHVGGNIVVDDANGLTSDETHEVTLTGAAASVHLISLPTGGLNSLGSLTLYGQQVQLAHDLHLKGNLVAQATDSANSKFFSTGGTVTLKADRTADIDNVELVDVALDLHDNSGSANPSNISRLAFSGFTSDRYQLTMHIDQDSSAFTLYNIAFDEIAEASHAYNFIDLFGHDVILNVSGATRGGSESTPAGSQLTVEEPGSVIAWNSTGG
jgi:hypothetical protein